MGLGLNHAICTPQQTFRLCCLGVADCGELMHHLIYMSEKLMKVTMVITRKEVDAPTLLGHANNGFAIYLV